MRQMATRMESTEMRQQQIMAFLARAVHNPAFLQQLLSARQNQRTLDNQGTPTSPLLHMHAAGQSHPDTYGCMAYAHIDLDDLCYRSTLWAPQDRWPS